MASVQATVCRVTGTQVYSARGGQCPCTKLAPGMLPLVSGGSADGCVGAWALAADFVGAGAGAGVAVGAASDTGSQFD